MPHRGFLCDATDLPVDINACLACARSGSLPGCHQTVPVIAGIVRGLRPADFGWTMTTLIGCVRKARLMRIEPYWLKPAQVYWAFRGQLLHGVAALYATETDHIVAEQRFAITVDLPDGQQVEVSGQPDLVLLDQRRLLDFKTTKSVPTGWRTYTCPETDQVISDGPYALRRKVVECPHCRLGQHDVKAIETISEPRAKPAHVLQLSLYQLLLHRHGIEVEFGEIIYLDMDTQRRVPVEMLSIAEAERYLIERVTLAVQPDLPPILTQADQTWECDYCPVRSACEALTNGTDR